MTRRKVCVVITARPSYSRVKTALDAIRANPNLELQLVVAASALLDRYGNVAEQISRDGFRIDARVSMVLEGENATSMAKTTGIGMIELATVFDSLSPDMVLTIADRYETLATATAAAFMGIPLVHLQGGEVTGSIDERVRHAITKLADLHLTSSDAAADRVVRMGEKPSAVFNTGCPSIDLAAQARSHPASGANESVEQSGVGPRVVLDNPFLVVMLHPVTSELEHARQQVETVLDAVEEIQIPALWFWPNVDAGADGTSRGIRHFRETHQGTKIRFLKNLPPQDFIHILLRSTAIVGNSSVAIRECAFLGVPAVNIGTRQLGRDRGQNVLDVSFDKDEIKTAIKKQSSAASIEPDLLYGDGSAGIRIAEILATYQFERQKRLTY